MFEIGTVVQDGGGNIGGREGGLGVIRQEEARTGGRGKFRVKETFKCRLYSSMNIWQMGGSVDKKGCVTEEWIVCRINTVNMWTSEQLSAKSSHRRGRAWQRKGVIEPSRRKAFDTKSQGLIKESIVKVKKSAVVSWEC